MDVGDTVSGRYRVVAVRSAGTCGRVFEAVDDFAEATIRDVANANVVLLHELDLWPTQTLLTALQALASRSKQNPALITTRQVLVEGAGFILVYDLPGAFAGARPETLTELARRSVPRLPAEEARAVVAALFEALAKFHQAGDVHGALSPRNVLRSGDACVLLGAGLASASSGLPVAGHQDLFAYGAPEFLRHEPPTPAADVFAAGAIAHQLLSGRVPNQGKNVLETLDNRAKLVPGSISRLLGGEPEPFLDAFFARALAPETDKRFRDGRALADAWRAQAMPVADVEKQPHLAKLVSTSSVAQREILRFAAEWLDQGGALLPTDLVVTLATELSDRIDRELCEAAWEDEDGPSSRARIFVGEADGGIVDSVDALPCAREDLRALVAEARRDVLAMLARVSVDHALRGVEGVGDSRSHVRIRIGPHRLLYCVRGGLVVLTHIMEGFDPVAKIANQRATPSA